MSKAILLAAFLVLAGISAGTIAIPHNPAFMFLSSDLPHQLVRISLLAVMLAQLKTNPPRVEWFRVLASAVGIFGTFWSIQQTVGFQIMLADTFAYLAASSAVIITAMELEYTDKTGNRHHPKAV